MMKHIIFLLLLSGSVMGQDTCRTKIVDQPGVFAIYSNCGPKFPLMNGATAELQYATDSIPNGIYRCGYPGGIGPYASANSVRRIFFAHGDTTKNHYIRLGKTGIGTSFKDIKDEDFVFGDEISGPGFEIRHPNNFMPIDSASAERLLKTIRSGARRVTVNADGSMSADTCPHIFVEEVTGKYKWPEYGVVCVKCFKQEARQHPIPTLGYFPNGISFSYDRLTEKPNSKLDSTGTKLIEQ